MVVAKIMINSSVIFNSESRPSCSSVCTSIYLTSIYQDRHLLQENVSGQVLVLGCEHKNYMYGEVYMLYIQSKFPSLLALNPYVKGQYSSSR